MVQEPEESALLLKRSSIPPVYSAPPEKSNPKSDIIKETGFRRLLNRQQSITRGTASSLAKAVRVTTASINNEKSPPNDTIRRKFSLKSRKQSLTGEPQRRSSWSPFSNTSPIIAPDSPPLTRRKSKLLLVDTCPPEEKPSVVDTTTIVIDAAAASTARNQQISSLETPSESPVADEDEHAHHHHYYEDNNNLPGYLQRPICAACTRNVKVTSSSETNNQQRLKSSHSSNSSGSSSSNSRGSFFSTATTKSQQSDTLKIKIPEPKTIELAVAVVKDDDKPEVTEPEQTEPHHNNESTNTNEPSVCSTSTSISSSIFETTRSCSPTSPSIPLKQDAKDKWCQLLSQQQHLLSSFVPRFDNHDDKMFDSDLITIQQNISKLVTTPHQEQYETLLLETQTKVLQKFASLHHHHHQQQQQQQRQKQTPAVESQVITITKIVEMSAPPPPSPSMQYQWQTKLEFSMARWKWDISQWTGMKVGTGNIEELDFDSFGYPENVIISGVCVTTEPELLPKSLQKYYKPYEEIKQVICHKYVIRLTREKRLLHYQIKPRQDWIADEDVKVCEFSVQQGNKTKQCHVEFGFFDRRHHCRSCGHIFCHAHSSNELPLFVSNGEDRGEWARVCDPCFYSRIEPHCISRS